jgi:hypothetical protein
LSKAYTTAWKFMTQSVTTGKDELVMRLLVRD